MNPNEPHFKKSSCAYCGDAGVPHALFYFDSLISTIFDPQARFVARRAPAFIKKFADWLPVYTFKTFVKYRLARFSSDIGLAKTFRSRVIWEEALRRGIKMEQLILFGKPIEYYRAYLGDKEIFFQSLPIPEKFLDFSADWDNKIVLKAEFKKHGLPVPEYAALPIFYNNQLKGIFERMRKPLIVKPRLGSRGRHTVTNIRTFVELDKAVKIARVLSPHIILEEHLFGYVCRATVVGGSLAGFYRGIAPSVVGDGAKTIGELIKEKNKNRPERVGAISIDKELEDNVGRAGFTLDDVLPRGQTLFLSHRVGRLFGGTTREMLSELHPSFVPILEKAARVTGLAVAGFDVIVPDPEQPADSQRWGIIECNTLPFIDLHYYALQGKSQNIAGMIWDLWQ